MSELVCLELSILLWVVYVLVQGALGQSALGLDYLSGARDDRRQPRGVYHPRATRALANYIENLAPFVAADLGQIVTNHTGGWGAMIWIVCRIVYLPLYLFGVPVARTIVWAISLVGLIMMLARLSGAMSPRGAT